MSYYALTFSGIDALFTIEREINGFLARRQALGGALGKVRSAARRIRGLDARRARHAAIAKAIDCVLTRWPAFTRVLEDGRICLSNDAAKLALRGLALGRKSWLFAGSERGAERAAVMHTLIQTAKLNSVDPQTWLADVLARIADTPQTKLPKLLPGTGTASSRAYKLRNRGPRRRVTVR